MSKRLEAWVFLRSGAERTHFGEVRYRLEGDTPMSDTSIFEEGWERAHWLDSDRGTRWDRLSTPYRDAHQPLTLPADREALIQRAVDADDGACSTMAPAPEVSEGAPAGAAPLAPTAELIEKLKALPRYNCDCLPSGPDGITPSDDPGSLYTERDVLLASDVDAALSSPPSAPAAAAMAGPDVVRDALTDADASWAEYRGVDYWTWLAEAASRAALREGDSTTPGAPRGA